ncbi:MAG: hypothetical protein ABII10_00775 [Candidatus Paceibacterota bacterium]
MKFTACIVNVQAILIYNVVLMRMRNPEESTLEEVISLFQKKLKRSKKPKDTWSARQKPRRKKNNGCPEGEKIITDFFEDL